MEKREIFEQIANIIYEVTDIPPEEITEESVLMDDLELSSLEVMTIIAEIEQYYHVKINEKSLRSFYKVEDIVNYIYG